MLKPGAGRAAGRQSNGPAQATARPQLGCVQGPGALPPGTVGPRAPYGLPVTPCESGSQHLRHRLCAVKCFESSLPLHQEMCPAAVTPPSFTVPSFTGFSCTMRRRDQGANYTFTLLHLDVRKKQHSHKEQNPKQYTEKCAFAEVKVEGFLFS